MPIPWNEVWQVVIAVAAAVVTLTAAGSAIVKLFNPYKQLKKRLEEQQREIEGVKQQIDRHGDLLRKDLERFERNDERDAIMLDATFALLEHARTNNSTGLMDEASKKMQAFLIHRK